MSLLLLRQKNLLEDAIATTATTSAQTRTPSTTTTIICSVDDYQALAKQRLSTAVYEYVASGTDEEQTLQENRSAFKEWYLRPRVMRPVGKLSTQTTVTFELFSRRHDGSGDCPKKTIVEMAMSIPLFISPAGLHALCDPTGQGECASSSAAGEVGIPFAISQHSTRTIEQIADTSSQWDTTLWYQAYILKERDITRRLIERAKQAGCQGIFLTVDSVRFGYREADARNGFDALPPPHRLVNYDLYKDEHKMDKTYNAKVHKSWDQNSELLFEQNLTWDDVRWVKEQTACRDLPLIVKGIMTAEDAILAIEAGANGVMVSNHGGRQQDGCLAAIDALPEVVEAVRGRNVPVFLDGGIRRGTDILKALALGASAVGIGKPVFFSLATGGGQSAVRDMLLLFKRELEAAMALTGCETIQDISSSLITRHPNGSGRPAPYIRSAL
ncbi:hypothetical protein ACA910_015113 [Epithemia clementina (nom. ined.)]